MNSQKSGKCQRYVVGSQPMCYGRTLERLVDAPADMPHVQWLVVKETDDDKTRSRKKKLQKSHKSKLRFQQLDQEVKHRQDSWQNFKKGKGAKKKVGRLSSFMTIMRVPRSPCMSVANALFPGRAVPHSQAHDA